MGLPIKISIIRVSQCRDSFWEEADSRLEINAKSHATSRHKEKK